MLHCVETEGGEQAFRVPLEVVVDPVQPGDGAERAHTQLQSAQHQFAAGFTVTVAADAYPMLAR